MTFRGRLELASAGLSGKVKRMYVKRRIVSMAMLLVGVVGLSLTGVTVAPAETDSKPGGPYCAMLVGKAPEGGVSPVLNEICSNKSHEEASASLKAELERSGADGSRAAADTVHIMSWFEHIDYGTPEKWIFGADGPCDRAGYLIEPDSWWKRHMSSIIGWNGCWHAAVDQLVGTKQADFSACINHNGRWLGVFSDNVFLIQPHYGICGRPD